jgi:pyridoxal phosphate enzyme (YggS family)
MAINTEAYQKISAYCTEHQVQLVAVSKTKPVSDILELYNLGHRDFGENYVQELVDKQAQLPADIRWHFIGHLQSNKVKFIAPFVHLIHGVDSFKLLKEINKQAAKNDRVIDVLLQMHIAREETKFGLDEGELDELLRHPELATLTHVRICGLMGMASFSDNMELVRKEFKYLKSLFDHARQYNLSAAGLSSVNCQLQTISMGMSGDYTLAIEEGSTMIRIGSLLFGARA